MKRYKETVKLKYKLLSKVYDLMDVIGFSIKKYNPRLGLAKHIPNESIAVLDVCFGTGNSGIAIAAKNDKNAVLGIDLSEEMLKVAQNKLRKKKLKNVTLKCMDAANIKYEDEFDITTTSLSLHEMPKDIMDLVISGMVKALKTNGKLFIIEWEKPTRLPSLIAFMFFPYIFEPKGFGKFLELDWKKYLEPYGLRFEQTETYGFTKLLIASKV